jgi:DNA-binding NarL/FixJ family response regulator
MGKSHPEEGRKLKVVVAEGDGFLGRWLARLVNTTPGYRCVGLCPALEELFLVAVLTAPDLIIMNLAELGQLPSLSLKAIKKALPGLKIFLTDAGSGPAYRKASLRLKADGFLPKDSIPDELERIRTDLTAALEPGMGGGQGRPCPGPWDWEPEGKGV